MDLLDLDVDDLTAVGAFTGSASPEGTFDQGGNIGEWADTAVGASSRVWRGGSFNGIPTNLAASDRRAAFPTTAIIFKKGSQHVIPPVVLSEESFEGLEPGAMPAGFDFVPDCSP